MYGVALALTTSKLDSSTTGKQLDDWIHANKICLHTLLNVVRIYGLNKRGEKVNCLSKIFAKLD